MTTPDWMVELIEVCEGKLPRPAIVDLILQTAPTRTVIASGFAMEHGVFVYRDSEVSRLLRIGVPGLGWMYVDEPIGDSYAALGRRGVVPPGVNVMLDMQDMLYFPIKTRELLPTFMHLSQYDVGHRVVIIRGELMGRSGAVTRTGSDLTHADSSCQVKLVDGNPVTILHTAIGVLRQGDPELLVSTGIRFPAGSTVYVPVRVRAGQPMEYRPFIVTGWSEGKLLAVNPGDGRTVSLAREECHAVAPATAPIAGTARGTNPAPRLRAKNRRRINVPPAQ